MGYIKKLKNNELVGGTDKTTIYPVTSTEAVFEEITNGNESSFKSQKTINKEQQDELDEHEERIQAAEAEDIKSITINGSTKKFEVDGENNVDLTIYTVDSDPDMPGIASNVEDLRNMVGTSTPVLETSHKARIETLEGDESVTGSVENKIKTKVDSINSSYQDDNNEYVKYSMTQTSGEVTNFNIDETSLKNAITSLNTSISGDNIVIRSGSTPSGTGEAGKIYRYVNSSNNTYTDYMYSGGSWVTLATHDTSNEQAQVAYYTCTATGSGAQATKQFVGNGSLTYTPSSGGHIKILMGETNTATGTIYLQFGTTTSTKKPLYYNGESVSSDNTWEAGETIAVYYDPSANNNTGAYFASNAQGGGGKAEKIKYDNSASGLAAENVQGAVDTIVGKTDISEHKIFKGFQVATNKASTTWYATSIGFEKGKKYHIRVTASTTYSNATSIILQTVSQQFEGQKDIGKLPANTLTTEFDYSCVDDGLQYFCIYASGNHTITYSLLISEYSDINTVVEEHSSILCTNPTYVNFYMGSTFVIASSAMTRSKYYTVSHGQRVKIKANSNAASYIHFLTGLPQTLSNNQDLSQYKVGSQIAIPADTEKIVDVPATAGILWVNMTTYYQGNFSNYEPEYISVIDGDKGFDDITNDAGWIVKDGAFFGSNGKYVLGNGSAFKYIAVQEGEKYVVVANSTRYCNYALMRSIPATITHWTDIDAVEYGSIPQKQDIVVEIPSGCNYLAVSVANAYQDWEPIYVGKSSARRSLNDNVLINTALINNVNTERILLIPVYGQSLAIGGDATPITTYCRFPKNCANTSGLTLQFGQSLETSVYGLVESYIDFKGQEDRVPAVRQTDKIASFSSGQGSTPISGLVKGTTLYNNLISAITTAYNNRAKNAMVIPAFCWVQGEGDTNNGVDYYYNALSQLREDLDADIKAITGQAEDVHCILYQTNQLCPATNSNFDASKYASGAGGALMNGSVTAQWKLIKDSPYFHASSPVYPMTFVVSPNNAIIHINGMSQKLLGYYEGLAAKRLMDGHGDDIGLYVTGVTKVDNTHIRLSLHVPAPPIVVDTESVYETPNYGFSVINENSQNIISAVSIERNNLDSTTILITTSTDCTNAKVRYGVNGTNGYSGFDKGPRGNIRDSQGLWYKAVINNRKVPMHNWLLFFEYLIN